MPKKLVIDALSAEAAELRSILAEAESVGDVVGVLQSKERLVEISDEIEKLSKEFSPYASVALYFSGKPVLGSRGIMAEFAGKTLENFQEIVSRTYAANVLGVLGERGRVPLKQNTDLMITGLTHGSFGFVLEELSDQDELHDTALKDIISSVSDMIISTGSENESDFERVTELLDARTLISLRDFFKNMDSSEATIRLIDDNSEFILDNHAISRGRMRTEAMEINEKPESITGTLKGFLPDHKRFEILDSIGNTIYGTASKEATEQFQMAVRRGLAILGTECQADFIIREIRPLNREPRLTYRLIEFHKLGESK
jgi:hypothetical protein